ncbi:histidine kinase [Aliarcobacter cryaerophilus ATCC 43158]|uniref:histidine kinase n=1 Tax=Aliarcobacter cryaerophilus ATCC 43158 TaxID=1032070 RepID=A0AAD0TT75_9BACT|nr:HAMP domain-containing sensor histidine kinase [Aliarcobacter cryaerophilus]AYJ79968.1 two-component system sensor histidine kinase [Aliarcobacter cryaerophilus ATCC 43158]PRM97467.1 histidine kinase [Aliarcobacter cryaerophilus]QCZ24197.1 histidine kinase [Aliarcobacter cryaerophilus ATCC 43158]
MNFKKIYFFISSFILVFFTILLVLFLNYFLIFQMKIIENSFIFILFLTLLGSFFFLLISTKILKPIFQSEENIKNSIKNRLHELNIPTSTIKINLHLLKKDLTDTKSLIRLERIEKANDSLSSLYNNMEYEFKKEFENIDLEDFSLFDALNNSLDKFEDIKKDTNIEVSVPKDIVLHSDYNGFIIVLDNLISNAIKYNSKENPYIKILFENSVLSIFNKGLGIDTKNIMLVFERYFQENSQNIGYGIGLAVVKEFCDKNSIGINIESFEDGNRINLNLKSILK